MSNDQATGLTAQLAMRSKRAVIYARVSSDEQAEKGYSLPSQLEACRKYAEQHGFIVVAEVTDDCTGTTLDRPGLDQVRTVIERGEADAVICYMTDRWTRKLAHLLILREELERAGIELHFVNKGKSEDTPESRFSENIEGVFNEYWREKIVEGARRGAYAKAKGGEVVGCGRPPYAYDFIDGRLVIVEEQAEIVRMIYQWYTEGHEDGRGPMVDLAIAHELSRMKIPTPGERAHWKRKRASGMWNNATVRRILTSEVYAGLWRFDKNIGNRGKGGKRPPKEHIKVEVPAIVSRDVWEAAQAQRERNKRMSKRNTKNEYLLRGMIRCICGAAMAGRTVKNHYYYFCTCGTNQYADLGEIECKRRVRGDLLDAIAWGYILDVMTKPDILRQGLKDAQEAERAARQPKQDRLAIVNDLIAECETEVANCVRGIAQSPGGVISAALQKEIERLNAEHASLANERDVLLADLAKEPITDEEIDAVSTFQAEQGVNNLTFEEKRQWLEFLRVEVVVGEEARIKCMLPIGERVFDLLTHWNLKPNVHVESNVVTLSKTFSLADVLFDQAKTIIPQDIA